MTTQRIPDVNEFTWAIIEIVRTLTIRNGAEWKPEDQIRQMIEADRAAIRKECADRAIRWMKYRGIASLTQMPVRDNAGRPTHSEERRPLPPSLLMDAIQDTLHVSVPSRRSVKVEKRKGSAPDLAREVLRLREENAAIRKECADRAIEWQKGACRGDWDKCRLCPDCDRLRAAIEGTP